MALTGLEAERSVSTMIRLGLEYVFLILRRGARRAGGGKIRLGPGDIGLLGSEDPSRTGDFNSYSKERRSPGWGLKDPSRSRGFNSYSKERRSPGWGSGRSVSEQGL